VVAFDAGHTFEKFEGATSGGGSNGFDVVVGVGGRGRGGGRLRGHIGNPFSERDERAVRASELREKQAGGEFPPIREPKLADSRLTIG